MAENNTPQQEDKAKVAAQDPARSSQAVPAKSEAPKADADKSDARKTEAPKAETLKQDLKVADLSHKKAAPSDDRDMTDEELRDGDRVGKRHQREDAEALERAADVRANPAKYLEKAPVFDRTQSDK